MTTLISLRHALPEDEEFLIGVYGGTRVEELAQVEWAPGQKEAFIRMQYEAQRAHYDRVYPQLERRVVVLRAQDVGRMLVAELPDELRMVDLALLPEYRNRGIGTELMQGLMRRASLAGKPVTLHVETFNPALRLYERLGFQRVAQRSIYWFMRWRPAPSGGVDD